MTKKRFTLDSEENGVCQCILVDGEEVPTCEIVKLLNELSDKCEFFEIENEALEDGATKYAELYHKSLKENEQLKKELKVYRKLASCGNCHYHDYYWFDDDDEFEVCRNGNDVTERICEYKRKIKN